MWHSLWDQKKGRRSGVIHWYSRTGMRIYQFIIKCFKRLIRTWLCGATFQWIVDSKKGIFGSSSAQFSPEVFKTRVPFSTNLVHNYNKSRLGHSSFPAFHRSLTSQLPQRVLHYDTVWFTNDTRWFTCDTEWINWDTRWFTCDTELIT